MLDGQQERLFSLPPGSKVEQIVETSEGPVALWASGSALVSAPLTLQGGQASLGKQTRHRVVVAGTAQEARELLKGKLAPAVEWAAIPNMNDDGGLDRAFLLTWSEAVPPEKGTDRSLASQRRILGMRNFMCGFSPSRPVQDPSVVKRIMVQRTGRDGAPQGPPREIARSEAGKEAPPLRLESRPKVREQLVPDSERVEFPEGLRSAPEQEIVSAGYEPAKQQGVVVLAQAGDLVVQLIDPTGKPAGAPARVGPARPVERRAALLSEGWAVPARQGRALLMLTGARAGVEIPLRAEGPVESWSFLGARLFASGEGAVLIGMMIADEGLLDSPGAWARAELKKGDKEGVYSPVRDSNANQLDGSARLEDGSMVLFARYVPEPSGPPSFQPRAWRAVFPKSPDGEPKIEDLDGEASVVDVFRDQVLLRRAEDGKPLEGVWLRSGTSAPLPGTEKAGPFKKTA